MLVVSAIEPTISQWARSCNYVLLAVEACTVAVAAASATGVAAVRIRHVVRRYGRRSELTYNVIVLSRLRCRQLECRILITQAVDLVFDEEIEDRAGVAVVVVDYVAGVVAHLVSNITESALDQTLRLAAAVSSGQLRIIETVLDGVVQREGRVSDTIRLIVQLGQQLAIRGLRAYF